MGIDWLILCRNMENGRVAGKSSQVLMTMSDILSILSPTRGEINCGAGGLAQLGQSVPPHVHMLYELKTEGAIDLNP